MQTITSDWLLILIALSLVGAGAWMMKWLATRAIKGLDDGQNDIKNMLSRIEERIVGKDVCNLKHDNIRLAQSIMQGEIDRLSRSLEKEQKGN